MPLCGHIDVNIGAPVPVMGLEWESEQYTFFVIRHSQFFYILFIMFFSLSHISL